jgi:hypothetical protein
MNNNLGHSSARVSQRMFFYTVIPAIRQLTERRESDGLIPDKPE